MDLFSILFKQSSINQLEPEQVHSLLNQSPKPFLLDVRTPGEFQNGHIPGAVLIPLDELSARIRRIPKGREIICICESGSRSSLASRQLSNLGYQVNNLHGGMNRWQRSGLQVKRGMA